MQLFLEDIKEYAIFRTIREIAEGWSTDRKFYVETKDGQRLLLRVSDRKLEADKRRAFERLTAISKSAIQMQRPVAFGVCNEGKSVYMLLSWVEGENLSSKLKTMLPADQYSTGLLAGKMLRTLHNVPVVEKNPPLKEQRIAHKQNKIKLYETSYVRARDDEAVLRFAKEHLDKIYDLPPVYRHGDFHSDNLVITKEGTIGLIDFNRIDCGDPYEDFRHIPLLDAGRSVPFATGVIDGYFEQGVPSSFWETLAVYVAQTSMTQINWAERFGIDEVDMMQQQFHKTKADYDAFTRMVPKWFEQV